jgi:L-2,4-diaminobutyrate decarboxylase
METTDWSRTAQQVIEMIAASIQASRNRESSVMPWTEPQERADEWSSLLAQPAELTTLIGKMIEGSTKLHNPGYIGHQVSVPDVYSSLVQLAVSCLNCSSATYEMSPAGTMMERAVVRWMCDRVGFGPKAGGVFCSGGSLGNLTAMLAMRQHKAGHDAWRDGAHEHQPLCVLVSAESHYSIQRAVHIMGWGSDGIQAVAVDHDRRLDPRDLEPAIARARDKGRRVIGIVANACSTATGAFDPLEPIADCCEQHDLWLHADGAHGASLLLSKKHRHQLQGIERADSVVWDAHKMLGVSMLSTGVLYRDEAHAAGAFAQDAAYMFTKSAEEEWYIPAHKTLECTKGSLAAPFFVHLATRGEQFLEDHVDRQLEIAATLAGLLRESSAFELLNEPQCNMVCFRLRDAGDTPEASDEFHLAVRQSVIREGTYYLTQARLDGRICLRCTLMNTLTTQDDLRGLLDTIERHASCLTASA